MWAEQRGKLAVAVVGGAVGARATVPAERLEAVDAYLLEAHRELGVPGMAVVIVDSGQVVREMVLGVAADGRPLTSQTPFMLASTPRAETPMSCVDQPTGRGRTYRATVMIRCHRRS